MAQGGDTAGQLWHLDYTAAPAWRSPRKLCSLCLSPSWLLVDPLQAWLPGLWPHRAASGSLASADYCASAPPGHPRLFALKGHSVRGPDWTPWGSLAFQILVIPCPRAAFRAPKCCTSPGPPSMCCTLPGPPSMCCVPSGPSSACCNYLVHAIVAQSTKWS